MSPARASHGEVCHSHARPTGPRSTVAHPTSRAIGAPEDVSVPSVGDPAWAGSRDSRVVSGTLAPANAAGSAVEVGAGSGAGVSRDGLVVGGWSVMACHLLR